MATYHIIRDGHIVDTQAGVAHREIVVTDPNESFDFKGVDGEWLRYERVDLGEAMIAIHYAEDDVSHCRTAGEMADLLLRRDGVPSNDTEARDWYHRIARVHMYPHLAQRTGG